MVSRRQCGEEQSRGTAAAPSTSSSGVANGAQPATADPAAPTKKTTTTTTAALLSANELRALYTKPEDDGVADLLDALKRPIVAPLSFKEKYERTGQLFTALGQKNNATAAQGLLVSSIAIFVFPLATFYVMRDLLCKHVFGIQDRHTRDGIAGASAVTAVLVVMVGYTIWAFISDEAAERKRKETLAAADKCGKAS